MKLTSLVFLPALLPASVLAGTVVFTDSQHLPANLPPDVPVVLLDGPDQLQAEMFGNCLQTRSRPKHRSGRLWHHLLATKTAAAE